VVYALFREISECLTKGSVSRREESPSVDLLDGPPRTTVSGVGQRGAPAGDPT
jgi:hypothetical protein